MNSADPRGVAAALGAFLAWGLFPIFWRALGEAPALQVMTHRIVWCFVLVAAWLAATRGPRWFRPLLAQPRLVAMLCASAVLIAANWWLYIWAVNHGHIVEGSLGYFINPLMNVVLGVVLLRERLNAVQWLSVAIAAVGVLHLTLLVGHPPWIALGLALSFGGYGLLRKLAVVESVPALGFESSVLFVPAVAYLLWCEFAGTGAFGHVSPAVDALLLASGLVTAIPLVLFAYGAHRIPFSLLGVMQYVSPSLQLACGVLLYGEPFTEGQQLGFGAIWIALALYTADGVLRWRRSRPRPA